MGGTVGAGNATPAAKAYLVMVALSCTAPEQISPAIPDSDDLEADRMR